MDQAGRRQRRDEQERDQEDKDQASDGHLDPRVPVSPPYATESLHRRGTGLFHHEGHEGVKGTVHRSTPTILGPAHFNRTVNYLIAHRILFFVSFGALRGEFPVASVPCEKKWSALQTLSHGEEVWITPWFLLAQTVP